MSNKAKKRKKFKIIIFIAIVIILIFTIKNVVGKDKIEGTWSADGVTIYQFNGKGEGYLLTSISRYDFTYTIKNKKIHIDFKNDKATDSDYEYTVKKDELTLKGVESTTGTYTLKKQK